MVITNDSHNIANFKLDLFSTTIIKKKSEGVKRKFRVFKSHDSLVYQLDSVEIGTV